MKRRSLTARGKTARHGLSAAPYTKKAKRPARYEWSRPQWRLPWAFYESVSRDAKGHPARVQSGQIKMSDA